MAAHPHVFAMVLAGGEGKRLAPLTADRAKPAVPFGGWQSRNIRQGSNLLGRPFAARS
jgi:hypothetical protein